MIKAIFLDRDGVINIDKHYLYQIEAFEFICGIFDVLLHLSALDYQLIIISNQSGISRGLYTLKDYKTLNRWMLAELKKRRIKILDTGYCPHSEKDDCACRKPKPGMILSAQKKHHINLRKSWMIGDKDSDIICAHLSGISKTILLESEYYGQKKDYVQKKRTQSKHTQKHSETQFILKSVKQIPSVITE